MGRDLPLRARAPIRLGFVPLNDCAPLAVAQELEFFRNRGIRVALSRELGWASVRAKLSHGELDASHATGAMPFVVRAGLDCLPADCLTALVINLNGNAITLSESLWRRGVRDGATLREFVRSRKAPTLTLGVVCRHSSHHFLLRHWLGAAGLDPDRDARVVVVPPPQMAANLHGGHLDGYCVGEPWNSVAIAAGDGWCAATSSDLAPMHPEKVLAARGEFASGRDEEHLALVAALHEAGRYCDDPKHFDEVAEILSARPFLNLPSRLIRRGMPGAFDRGHGLVTSQPDFTTFHRDNTGEPTREKAAWITRHLLALASGSELAPVDSRGVFRADLFARALAADRSAADRPSSSSPAGHPAGLNLSTRRPGAAEPTNETQLPT